MKTITTKANTFYYKKAITDDIGVMPVYGDAYVGLSTSYDINSNPDTSFYLVESDTVGESDFGYGEGTINDIYLNLYVNTVTQEATQTPPFLDIYMLKPNIDITEGNLTIVSGNYTAPVLLYNSYNTTNNWAIENFDGTPKDFMNAPVVQQTSIGMYTDSYLLIKRHQLMDIAFEGSTVIDPKKDEHDGILSWDNLVEEFEQGIEWTQYQTTKVGHSIVQYLGEIGDSEEEHQRRNDEFYLRKGSDGLWGLTFAPSKSGLPTNVYAKPLTGLRKDLNWWTQRGARTEDITNVSRGGRGSANTFNQFDETYQSRCTQLNSIFSQVQSSPDVRDIKDQTLEGPGDSDRFIAYAYSNLEQSETPTDGLVLRQKAFWENYAGDFSGVVAQNAANCFGQDASSESAFPQNVINTIYGIPQPTPIDITTSGTGVPAYAPEIEIVFKINDMDVTTFATSGTYVAGQGNHTLDRSWNIIFNDDAHSESEVSDSTPDLAWASRLWRGNNNNSPAGAWDTAGALYSSGSNFSPWISFIRTSSTSESVDVICNANYWSNRYNILVGGGFDEIALENVAPYRTTVPMGEWITMRIKLNMYESTSGKTSPGGVYVYNASGGASIVYFPGLYDSQGKVRSCLLAHGRPWGVNSYTDGKGPVVDDGAGATAQVYGNNAHYPNMTMWLNNMRAINQVGGGVSGHINRYYSKVDNIISDDKTVDILVDSISFKQWGPDVANSTVCVENGMGQMTKIPSATFMTPMIKQNSNATSITAATVAVNPTGTATLTTDNYYTQPAALTASYLSFGFPEKTVIGNDKHHDFLFNNFSVGREMNALPITMVSGGYFTSGNYNGLFGDNYQNNWFDNLTVGDSTKELHITGGVGSVDNFVQKGTMTVKSDFNTSSQPWVKTGNPLVGAKILSIAQDRMSIVVDKPKVFDVPLNTPLCVELNNVDYKFLAKGTGSVGYYDSVGTANTTPLRQTKIRNGNKIFLSRPLLMDDAGSTQFGTWNFDFDPQRNNKGQGTGWPAGVTAYAKYYNTNYNLTKATVSPYQYWFNMALLNASSSAAWGASFGDVTQSHTKVQQTRTYDGIVPVSGGSTLGSTFNESLYNDGTYANRWEIDFNETTNTLLNLTTDYGFGSINSQSESEIPDSDGGIGRVGRDSVTVGENYINLGSYVYVSRPGFNQPFNLLVKPTYMDSFNSLYRCNINTREAASNKAVVIYGIKDHLPQVDEFTVSPIINTKGVNDPVAISQMTKAQSTDVVFNWKEGGDDINYRMLWVDTDLIENKYHKANFIAPNTKDSGGKYYTSAGKLMADDGTAMTGSYITEIEGVCGWGKFNTGAEDQYAVGPIPLGSASEFTFTCHIKPSGGSGFTTAERCVFQASGNHYGGNYGTFTVSCDTDNTVKVRMNSGSATLTSTTSYAYDNLQPLAIVVTYDKALSNNNFKLYINGKLEDTDDYTSDFKGSTDQRVHIGVANTITYFKGYLEEFTFHTKAAYVPQNNKEFILKTGDFPDMTSGKNNRYQSRLFLFDYHNVRGTSAQAVCKSNSAAWKITGVT